ncbi:MAG: response regulator transcription factor [Ruminococcus sp.]|nr:response regulator transcription factor [Ruminococcus sp.]
MAALLLIEDDEQLARNLIEFLKSEGYSTAHATGQEAGLELFENNKYDCVLVDISLKDGNGFSVCARIKQDSDVPVIFLTAQADEACTVAGFDVGADDYVSKPFRPRELVARIKNAMRRNTPSSSLLSCGGVTIDKAKGKVMKNGSELFLSALEYRLLLVFFTHKDQVLSRDMIADELWSFSGEFVSDNTLNVYMKRLRDKIEDDPQNPSTILTVRGLGYKAVDR